MDKKLISIYTVPVLISITVGIILIAISTIRDPFTIGSVFAAAILGTFVLDSEYILNAAFLTPHEDFSKTLLAFFKHGDFVNAAKHIHYYKNDTKELSLNSALFQIVLACLSVFVVFSTRSAFAYAFVLAVYANSIYVFLEYIFKNRTDEWFWTFKAKPNKQGAYIYTVILVAVLVACFFFISL